MGGDFYQYYPLPGGRLAVGMADVTGHAMDAAIPAVMFSGILDSQMRAGCELETVFGRLNEVLCERLTGRTHVALVMCEIDGRTGRLRCADAGCPYPCHYHGATREITEVGLDAYPLGVRRDTAYRALEARLQPGDYLVLYSDDIAETGNPASELFGFERTVATIQDACAQGLSPEEVVKHLVTVARSFAGQAPQADDMTCVVLRMMR
ncbi:MAG: PP2C family protein-serine/threonine phosphatase [Candidatus Latescibacterota bacterium]